MAQAVSRRYVATEASVRISGTTCGFNDTGGRAVYGIGLRPRAYWDRGFESHRGAWMFVLYSVCVVR
jgi:hypothetical protein